MVRWIVIALVVVNIAYFAWGTFSQSRQGYLSQIPADHPGHYGKRLQLLSENGLEYKKPDSWQENPEGEKVCLFIGPFHSSGSADQIQQQLFSLGVPSKERFAQGQDADFWVYIPPLSSRNEAVHLLRALQAESIDSSIIIRGEFINGISVGVYDGRDRAEEVSRRLIVSGYKPEIKRMEQEPDTWWLELRGEDADVLGENYWDEVTRRFNGIKKIEKHCKGIASGGTFL
ncbi:SPOR domain-containing protein [Endozoicomonas sp. Mp262]|uniref:SPOR domain-containing protein n=1 Tax=Endozoicomonas sp. Mp262 TaxID=2919499 RepID=UPI0021D8BB2A